MRVIQAEQGATPSPGDYIAELRRQRKQLEVQLAGETPPSPRRKGRQEEHALSLLLSDLRRLLQQPPSPNFPATLLSSPLDGLGLLLDLLKLVQLCQANTGHKERGLSQAVFKRALGDEYEILGCIKEAVQTEAGLERLAQHGSGLFTVSVCVMSNFSKSRVLALQVLTEMCSLSAGHNMVADSVAMLRLRFGEPVRFKFIVGMLCSYNSGSFQLSCLRFLNTFLETAASLEERVYIQEELRIAGLEAFDLQSLGQQAGIRDESLKEETARWHRNHIDLTALVAESQDLRATLQEANKEVTALRERCKLLEIEGLKDLPEPLEDQEVTEEPVSDDERVVTPQPDYPTSPPGHTGTLGERDLQGEEVLVQALTISLDTFRQRYQQHPPTSQDGNWQLQEQGGQKVAKSRQPSKSYFHKKERRLPKTPEQARRKELVWDSEQFERIPDGSGGQKAVGDSEEEVKTQHYNTMDTMSTRSFGFSRPSGTFARRERERRVAQHRTQFVLQETSTGGQKMVHYRRPGARQHGSLARSKSMDMVAMANRTDESKRRIHRASSVSRVDQEEEDWRERTPFLSPRRGGRRGDRHSWGLDEQGPMFEVAGTAQRLPLPLQAVNSLAGQGRRGGRGGSPPPPVPTPDYPVP